MLFPELRRAMKGLLPDSGDPISLNLKAAGVVFDSTADEAFYKAYPEIRAMLSGGAPSWSGETVSRETALNHSVVWATYRLLTETMGFLPASLRRQVGDSKVDAVEHPMYSAMLNSPNVEMPANVFKEIVTGDCMLDGDGWAKITRRSGTGVAIALDFLSNKQVKPDREKQGQKRLVYQILNSSGGTDKEFTVEPGKPHEIFHLHGLSSNGISGHNVINMGRQSIGSAIAAERNVGAFWANGGRVPYLLQMVKRFESTTKFEQFRAEWEKVYKSPHRAPMLEDGTTYKQTGLSMVDAQALETRQWTVSEISRWWGVSPHLVGDLSKATFSNIEQLFLEFKTIPVARWAKRWEQCFNHYVLTDDEKTAGYFLKINIDALLRGDFASRMTGYTTALQNGHKNIDEVRDLEDLNALPNGAGKAYRCQLNMQTIPGTGEPTATEIAIINRSKGGATSAT